MTELEKFNLFIDERINQSQCSAIPTSSIAAYEICRNYVNEHFTPKSEQLKQQAAQEDNDLVAMGIGKKAIREERNERWDAWKDDILKSKLVISHIDSPTMGKIMIEIKGVGIVDYFPKANKVLIRKTSIWHKPGLNWLINILAE